MSLYHPIESPFSEALKAIVGKLPDHIDLRGAYVSTDLPGQAQLDIQDWASGNARPAWATGEGIIDAADLLVSHAIDNDNILCPSDKEEDDD